jgi:iron(III) transport system permease protein
MVLAIALADARSRGLLLNTLQLAAGALSIAAPAGAFLGLTLARTDVFGKRAAMVLLGGLLLVPPYLQAAAWQAGFGIEGWQTALQSDGLRTPWLDGWRGAIWVHGCAGVPWVALFVGVAARAIPREWEELASLDLSTAGVLRRVTLRLAAPAIVLGALWVAITTMAEMSVTDLFAVRTYAEELYVDLNLGSWNVIMDQGAAEQGPVPALAGAIVFALAAAGAFVVARGVIVAPHRLQNRSPMLFSLGRWRGVVSSATWLLVGMLVLVPLGGLVFKAGAFVAASEGEIARGWSPVKALVLTVSSPREHAAEFQWSLWMAAGTCVLTLLVAVPLAYAARTSKLAGYAALLLAGAGLAVPGPLVSLALISVFNQPGWPALNFLYDRTIAAPVLAQSLRAFPLAFFLAWHAFATLPRSLIEAATLDGAGPLRRLWMAIRQRPVAMFLAGLAAAVVSLGELAGTILLVAPGIVPVSVRLFQLLHYNVEDQVAAITLMLMLFHAAAALVLLAVGRRLFRVG